MTPLRSLLRRMKEEDARVAERIDSLTSERRVDERRELKDLQRRIRDHILILSKMVEGDQIGFENFPVFQDIELAERMAEKGRVEEAQQDVAVSL